MKTMKKLLLLLVLGFTIVGFSQTTLIPDPNFEQALIDLGYDTAPINGSVPTANISGVTELNVNNYIISDLTGIEDFTALTKLICWANELTSLDVSNNLALNYLDCDNNQLTSLDVSNNTALTYLYCFSNELTSLDVSSNISLAILQCQYNQLTSLDVSNNTSLTYLDCDNNQLTSLDVNNTALTYLNCGNNQLTSLDVSNNTDLTTLNCYNNQLTSLDVSNNTAFTWLSCYSNQLTSLDVSNNTALTYLDCDNNQLTSLDVSNNTSLIFLICYNNQLTSLDVSNNLALTGLLCYNNELTSLDVRNGNNTGINEFDSTNNPDLICIFVDDTSYSNTNWTDIDPASTFVNNEAECEALSPPPANDLCIDAIDIEDITFPHSGSTLLASSFDAPECEFVYPDTPGVWYVATVPNGENYMVTIDTFGSSYDTTLSILTGDCGDLVCLVSNDDSSGTTQSEVIFEALSGNSYYIYVSGFGGFSGEYILNVAAEQLAINDNIIEGFSYYPNPSTGTINLSAIYNIEKVTIYNLLGQKVIDKNINATSSILNIASLNTGAYLMQVTSEGKKAIYKILKN